MSVSGGNTSTSFSYTARQIMERAMRQAGIPRDKFGGEMVSDAFDIFNTALLEMLNLGMQLWGRDVVLLPVYENRNQVVLPLGTSLVLDLQQRTCSRPTPVLISTDAPTGDPALAFDNDLYTGFILPPTASVEVRYASATRITQLGIYFGPTFETALFCEVTRDGVTWQTVEAINPAGAQQNEWRWYELNGLPSDMIGIRLRNLGALDVTLNEVFFGNNPVDIPMGRWNVNDWDQQVNKQDPGMPWNYYQDRTRETPTLYVWQCPNQQARYISLVCRRRRYLDNVTNMQQALDISPRWYEAFTASMARRFCKEFPEADLRRFPMLLSEEGSAMLLATGEERDNSPVRWNPGLDVYNF